MATYFVSTIGADSNQGSEEAPWRTISYAVEQLLPQDTLLIRGGVYAEQVEIGRGGVTAAPITIAAYPGEEPILDCATVPMETWAGILHVYASDLIFDGLTIRNSQMNHNRGINLHSLDPAHRQCGVAIRNCTIYNIGESPITLSYMDNCVIEDCLLYNSQLEFAPENRQDMSGWGGAGVVFTRGSSNCTMRRCITHGGWGEAFLLDMDASHCTVEDCIFYDMFAPVYIHRSQFITIRRNFVYTTPKKEDGILSRGIAFGNEEATIGEFQALDGLLIENNIVVGATIGINGGTTANEALKNITIRHNTVVNSTGWDVVFDVPLPCQNVLIENNIFQTDGDSIPGTVSPQAAITWRSNCWSKQPDPLTTASGDIVGNPALVNANASVEPGVGSPENYRLTSNSPCVNQAVASTIVDDYWQTLRSGTRNDIGAHELA